MSESANTPTVVLVHGGFADASFWVPVIKDLQAHDLPVLAPPNPLRGLAHDAEYIASYVNQIDGPVLLVGHSYGGAVISVAGASTPNAVGLVFVAAFALDEGESFAEIFAQFGDTPLLSAVRPGSRARAPYRPARRGPAVRCGARAARGTGHRQVPPARRGDVARRAAEHERAGDTRSAVRGTARVRGLAAAAASGALALGRSLASAPVRAR